MNVFLSLIIFISIIFLLTSIQRVNVFAAPAMDLYVINESAKACGIFWPGDEFRRSEVPEGWKVYNPENGKLETPFGECDMTNGFEACCKSLGMQYLDENLTVPAKIVDPNANENYTSLFMVILTILSAISLAFIVPKTHK